MAARIEDLPETARGRAATVCWSALKAKFGCGYKEIAPEQFTEAVSLVARIVLEGELLEPEAPKVLGRLPIDFPIEDWNGGVSAANLSAGVDLDNPSGPDASMVYSGLLEFEHMGGNVWAFKSTISRTDNTRQTSTSGAVALPGALTTLRLTTHNGTASFDAGTASLTYEG